MAAGAPGQARTRPGWQLLCLLAEGGDTPAVGPHRKAGRAGLAYLLLGRSRAVTLEGELLEKSGAMTGGSFSQRGGGLSFGASSDGDEAAPLRQRLLARNVSKCSSTSSHCARAAAKSVVRVGLADELAEEPP